MTGNSETIKKLLLEINKDGDYLVPYVQTGITPRNR